MLIFFSLACFFCLDPNKYRLEDIFQQIQALATNKGQSSKIALTANDLNRVFADVHSSFDTHNDNLDDKYDSLSAKATVLSILEQQLREKSKLVIYMNNQLNHLNISKPSIALPKESEIFFW